MSHLMRKLWLSFCMLTAAHVASAQTFTGGVTGLNPIRIGFIAPLTSSTADSAHSMRMGAELAVQEINELGGYLGRPLELLIRDDKANPDEGRRISEELVLQEKVHFTIGFCNTHVAMKSLDVFQDNKHVLMVPCSQGTALTTKYPAVDSYIFRVAPPDRINAKFLVNEIVLRRGIKKVAVFGDTTGYGQGGIKDVSSELAKHRLEPVFVAKFPLGVKSLNEEMRSARDAGAEALVVYTVSQEHAVAAKSRLELGWQVPYFGPWPLAFRSALEKGGEQALEGTMMVQSVIKHTANERRSSFLARYFRYSKEARIGSMMSAAQTYDAVHLMLFAMFQLRGDITGPRLKHALENKERPYRGIVTTYTEPFSSRDHDAFTLNMVWLGVWRRGQVEFLYEDDAKQSAIFRRKDYSDTPPTPNGNNAYAGQKIGQHQQASTGFRKPQQASLAMTPDVQRMK